MKESNVKTTYCMIPTIRHSRKDKIIFTTIKIFGVEIARSYGKEG